MTHRGKRWSVMGVVLALGLLFPPLGRTQEALDDAEQFMRQGNAAYERRDLPAAKQCYERALAIRERLAPGQPRCGPHPEQPGVPQLAAE